MPSGEVVQKVSQSQLIGEVYRFTLRDAYSLYIGCPGAWTHVQVPKRTGAALQDLARHQQADPGSRSAFHLCRTDEERRSMWTLPDLL